MRGDGVGQGGSGEAEIGVHAAQGDPESGAKRKRRPLGVHEARVPGLPGDAQAGAPLTPGLGAPGLGAQTQHVVLGQEREPRRDDLLVERLAGRMGGDAPELELGDQGGPDPLARGRSGSERRAEHQAKTPHIPSVTGSSLSREGHPGLPQTANSPGGSGPEAIAIAPGGAPNCYVAAFEEDERWSLRHISHPPARPN